MKTAFLEADVHTATPSIGNAAATWAGWAVTAVTAKFYRSQSDSSRPRPPLTGRNLSKPASLGKPLAKNDFYCAINICVFIEQPSSSSLSTTTSSVTSMTSLEHESNDTSASASDYGNNDWDNENWGEMDVSKHSYKFIPLKNFLLNKYQFHFIYLLFFFVFWLDITGPK